MQVDDESHRRLTARHGLELAHGAGEMLVDRRLAQVEIEGDLLGRLQLRGAQEDVTLARGQSIEAIHGQAHPRDADETSRRARPITS